MRLVRQPQSPFLVELGLATSTHGARENPRAITRPVTRPRGDVARAPGPLATPEMLALIARRMRR